MLVSAIKIYARDVSVQFASTDAFRSALQNYADAQELVTIENCYVAQRAGEQCGFLNLHFARDVSAHDADKLANEVLADFDEYCTIEL